MVQRRARSACRHRDATRPYPMWPDPGWPLGEDLETDEALAELESALTDCDVALTDSIAELTSQDVSSALRSVPLDGRPAVLRPLGLMLTPRKINQILCQDVRNRMRRVAEHAAGDAAPPLLTSTTLRFVRS